MIIAKAHVHVPALLQFAHAGQEAAAAAAADPPAAGDDDFDWEGDEDTDKSDGADGGDAEDQELLDARSWDTFLTYVHELRPFEGDSDAYKEKRAVAAFNAAGPMVKEYKRLNPDAKSACPHVALCIVPQQVSRRVRLPTSPPHVAHTRSLAPLIARR